MPTKTLTITTEAYARLAAHKRGKESFTDVINRLTTRSSLLELRGILPKSAGERLKKSIDELRASIDADVERRTR